MYSICRFHLDVFNYKQTNVPRNRSNKCRDPESFTSVSIVLFALLVQYLARLRELKMFNAFLFFTFQESENELNFVSESRILILCGDE